MSDISGLVEPIDPRTPQTVVAAAPAEDAVMVLSLADLVPDSGGEVAVQSFGVPTVGIETAEAVRVTAQGTSETHVTAAGEDVSGYSFYSFDNGITLYFPPDMVVLVTPPANG